MAPGLCRAIRYNRATDANAFFTLPRSGSTIAASFESHGDSIDMSNLEKQEDNEALDNPDDALQLALDSSDEAQLAEVVETISSH